MEEQAAQAEPASDTKEPNVEGPVRNLLVWYSPSRPPLEMTRELFATAVSICLLLSVIVSFFQEFMLVILIWAALFFIIALSKRPPDNVEHKITTQGIVTLDRVYLWENLGPFWFTKKGNQDMLHVIQQGNLLGTLLILLPEDLPADQVRDVLAKYLSFVEKPEKSRTDKFADWFTKKLAVPPSSSKPSGKII